MPPAHAREFGREFETEWASKQSDYKDEAEKLAKEQKERRIAADIAIKKRRHEENEKVLLECQVCKMLEMEIVLC